jgi:GTPase SAR1 family protein
MHFCSGLPIILVGCKMDLRYDQKTIEELHKTSQKPVTPEQVRILTTPRLPTRHTNKPPRLREVFEHATRSALTTRKTKSKKKCLIL